MARTPNKRIADAWKARLRRFHQQNQSVARFCQNEGVSTAAFYKWKKKLETPQTKTATTEITRRPFAPVQLAFPQTQQNVVVEMPGGTRILLPPNHPETLQLTGRTIAQLDDQRASQNASQNEGDASC